MTSNYIDLMVEELYELSKFTYTNAIINRSKSLLVDYVGVTLAGSKILKENEIRYLKLFEHETGNVPVIGLGIKTSRLQASFLNGMSSHVAELDDGHREGMVHPGGPIISALLSSGDYKNIHSDSILKGIIVGYEAAIKIAKSIQPYHKERGYHTSGTCGSIGAAVGVGISLDFSKDELKTAISAAVTSAAGILGVQEDQSELKPFNIGQASLNGVSAAFIAKAGLKGPEDIFSGERGFFHAMINRSNLEYVHRASNDNLAIEEVYTKLYASCRHSHPCIEAAIKLKEKHNLSFETISEVIVDTYRWAVNGHDHKSVTSVSSAKMSTPYCVAVSLLHGKAGITEYTEDMINDTRIKHMISKVRIVENDELSSIAPKKRAAIVEVITHEGKSYIERVDYPKGEPENPLTEQEQITKFISLAKYSGKTEEQAKAILKCIMHSRYDLVSLYELF